MAENNQNQVLKLEGFDRHIVLYAKNHYKRSDDAIDDLKTIVAHVSGSDKKHIGIFDIYENVIETFLELSKLDWEVGRADIFWKDIWKSQWCRRSLQNKLEMSIEEFIKYIVFSFIQLVPVMHGGQLVLDIGEPDYNILPKSPYLK